MNWYKKADKIDISNISQSGNPIEDYLESIRAVRGSSPGTEGFHYQGPEDFLLQNGKHFESNPMTEEEKGFLKKMAWKSCGYRMKECFFNAQDFAQLSSKIKYVEGYLYSGIIPIEHAWNSLNGKVIDFTMYHANNNKPILGDIPEGWDYFGVELPTRSITEYWAEYGQADPMISNWNKRYPLLREPFRAETEIKEKEGEENELV